MENIVHNDTNIKNTIVICLLSINNGLPIAWYEEGAQLRDCINVDEDMKLGFLLPIIYVLSTAKCKMRYVPSNPFWS